jgi:hemoglobin-like flavoprotein
MTSPTIPTLTPAQKRLVRESFESASYYSVALTKLFYGRLFELEPAVRPLFKGNLEEQSLKLLDMLRTVVDALDRFAEVRPLLVELGRKHVTYGARPEHYEVVSKALLWALSQALELQFDGETKEAWEQMLGAISAAMLEGAASQPLS